MTRSLSSNRRLVPVRERVTWTRWDADALRMRTSRPYWWRVTEPDGYERYFTSRQEAVEWIAQFEIDEASGTEGQRAA